VTSTVDTSPTVDDHGGERGQGTADGMIAAVPTITERAAMTTMTPVGRVVTAATTAVEMTTGQVVTARTADDVGPRAVRRSTSGFTVR
jgi:hypothetical protein